MSESTNLFILKTLLCFSGLEYVAAFQQCVLLEIARTKDDLNFIEITAKIETLKLKEKWQQLT